MNHRTKSLRLLASALVAITSASALLVLPVGAQTAAPAARDGAKDGAKDGATMSGPMGQSMRGHMQHMQRPMSGGMAEA